VAGGRDTRAVPVGSGSGGGGAGVDYVTCGSRDERMRMMGERWRVLGDYDVAVGTIVRIEDAEPEQLLAAAVLVMAVREAVGPKVLRIVREDAIDFLSTGRC